MKTQSILVEVECDRVASWLRPIAARIRTNAWLRADGTIALVGAVERRAKTLPAAEWYDYQNAVLIGEIDASRFCEAARVLYDLP
jgi:hypothetical protein